MFRKEEKRIYPDLTTLRAEIMLAVYQPPRLDIKEIQDSGTAEPCFTKVRRLVTAGTVRRVKYLRELLELWVAVLDAGYDTEEVVVFAGTKTHYNRVRFINGEWGIIPEMKRPNCKD